MAIAHLRVDTVSRATGGTAINAADYALGRGRHRAKAADVIAHGHAGPALDWRLVDRAEDTSKRRATAKVARTMHTALPCELGHEAHARIAQAQADALRQRHGVAVLWSIHAAPGDERNVHLHLVVTTRRVSDGGQIGEKTRELDVSKTSSAHIEAWRQDWQNFCNAELAQAGDPARIDMRSFARQGRTDAPTVHLGPQISARVKKGYHSEKHEHNQAILAARHAAADLAAAEQRVAGFAERSARAARVERAVASSQLGAANSTYARAARASCRVAALTQVRDGRAQSDSQRQGHSEVVSPRAEGRGRARARAIPEPVGGPGGFTPSVGLSVPGSGRVHPGEDRAGVGGRDHAAEPVIVLRVKTLTGITRYVRADDLVAAREGQQPYVPTCDQYGVREADLHPRRPAFLHRLRTENIVQADALPPIRVEAEPVPVAAAPIAATTAAGLVLDPPEEETEGYSL